MNLGDYFSLLISLTIVIYGAVITGKYYFSLSSRFEDYYFFLAILSVIGYYIGIAHVVFTQTMKLNELIFIQAQLTWSYWFLLMFFMKRNFFKKQPIRKLIQVLITLLLVVGSTVLASTGERSINEEVVSSSLPILMKIDYGLDKTFFILDQSIKLVIISLSLIFAWRIEKQPSWLLFGLGFLLTEETLTLINNTIFRQPLLFIFTTIQILIVFTIVFIIISVQEYFKKRELHAFREC